jgi:hypothetical protein
MPSDDETPELPQEVYDALKSDQLRCLKISKDAFNCFFGLWYRLNVVPSNELKRVRPTARIVPISVVKWNTLNGGGDAITKLIDSCRERLNSEERALLCARILMHYAVVFRRFN